MKFTKYHKFGAYHWNQYKDKNTKYSRHADRVYDWVKEDNVLDVGAGDGLITYLLEAVGIDNEPEAVRLAQKKGVDVKLGDAYNIEGNYDAIFMGDVLEHLEFPRKSLQSLHAAINDYLYLVTPEKGTNNDPFHYQEWTADELKVLVESEGFELVGEILEVPQDKRIYGKFKKVEKRDLSILIPSRNEMFLSRTVEDLLEHIEGDTEIIVGLDGAWSDPPMPQHDRVTVVYYPESIGQRAMTNQLCKLSKAKYVLKVDAHCSFDQGFDVKMLQAYTEVDDNVTMIPTMRNLWAFDWKCFQCGWKKYQGPTPEVCPDCGETKKIRRKILWIGKERPQSNSFCFDSEPHFQYFNEYKKYQKGDIVETMSLQGSCFMLTREKYWELKICDEDFGSWGSQGIEVAVKTWLSGGRCLVNKRTWYAHLFRTQGGDFSFPYKQSGNQVQRAKRRSKDIFFNNKWDQQVRPLSWLVEKFWPVKGWTDEDLQDLKKNDHKLKDQIVKM